ncbi:peptidylprolyl isomerase [Parasediminibacterium sp. JCM 36343]|uniref:peptidylprolyl isomerase n=1 Tax=Parasediminibacterium sp. JCM 36343 TaxID=3374279 RepID=UPI00397CF8A4
MKRYLLGTIILLACLGANAQVKKVLADKIVAQVGDKIILRSDITNAIADYKRQGQEAQLPANPECAFLEGQLIQKALVLQAEKDSLPVSEDEIEAGLDNQIRGFINAYGSKDVLEEVAGRTVYQIKEDFRQVFKERKLADQMRGKILESIKISPTEAKAYYNKIPKDSLPFYESEIELSQVQAQPKASKEIEEYCIKQLYEYKRQIESGGKKFEQLCKLYSEDPGSKDNGGQYNINRTNKEFDPTFTATAFRLKDGQISNVIKTKFGYHIIQMVSRSGDDAIVRHILKIPPVTDDEIKISVDKLDTVRNLLVKGKITFGEAVDKFSDDENSKFSGGNVTARDGSSFLNIDQLDKDLVIVLKDLKPGQISKPSIYTDERGRKMVRIVYLKNRTQPHRENLKDDYNRVAARALEQKKQATLEKWFKEHLPTYFITIDNEFKTCNSLSNWWKYAANGAN